MPCPSVVRSLIVLVLVSVSFSANANTITTTNKADSDAAVAGIIGVNHEQIDFESQPAPGYLASPINEVAFFLQSRSVLT